MRNALLCCICLLLAAAGCKPERKLTPAFYYWRTTLNISAAEHAALQGLQARRLYLRLADIDMDPLNRAPVPLAPLQAKGASLKGMQVVPVYYVVNDIYKYTDSAAIRLLARRMAKYTAAMLKQAEVKEYSMYQIDCDWTAGTRDKYFYLLKCLQQQDEFSHKTLSVTLRLHQLRHKSLTGIPPADRALLMCYNMGNMRQYGTNNSIINLPELKRYAGPNLGAYNMPLDVALPIFSWTVVFRQKQYAGLLRDMQGNDVTDTALFIKRPGGLYAARQDIPALRLKAGDELRPEAAGTDVLRNTAAYLADYLKRDSLDVVYFDLNAGYVQRYGIQALNDIIKPLGGR